jgi:hypothetical protein
MYSVRSPGRVGVSWLGPVAVGATSSLTPAIVVGEDVRLEPRRIEQEVAEELARRRRLREDGDGRIAVRSLRELDDSCLQRLGQGADVAAAIDVPAARLV